MFQPSKQQQYQKVSLNSDSDDDEDILYTITPLNDTTRDDRAFGAGVYNRDLRLNLSNPNTLLTKTQAKRKERQNMIYSGLCFAALVVIAIGLSLTIIVYAQVYLPNSSVNETENSMCVTSPPPLPNLAVNDCQGKQPPPFPPTSVPTSQSGDTTSPTSQSSDTTSQPSDTTSQSGDSTSQPSDSTSQSGDSTSQSGSTAPTWSSVPTEPPPQATKHEQVGTTHKTGDKEEPTEPLTQPIDKPLEPTSQTLVTSSEIDELYSTQPPSQSDTEPPQTPQELSELSHQVTTSTLHTGTPSPGVIIWSKEYFPAATELSLQYLDINGDSIQEVLVGKVSDPCGTELLALDGLSSVVVWSTKVNFDIFSLRCEIDVNKDGTTDCLASGRFGGFIALNSRDGSILWVVDSSITFPKYNFYFPMIIKDLDLDGVPDIINTHGGDAEYPPWVKERSPGFLVVISGGTGGKLMEPIPMPDGHETYCSPILFSLGGTELVLFGSGGETVSGSLWAISLHSIRLQVLKYREGKPNDYKIQTKDTFHPCFMNNDFIQTLRSSFNATAFNESVAGTDEHTAALKNCPKLDNIWNAFDLCIYEILHNPGKGVVLPPLILDLNADNVDDLLVSTFTGHVYALDGKDLTTKMWEEFYPGTESYSLPTPLFYSDDFFPDLLLRANLGTWSEYYNTSTLHLVDGHTGKTIWSVDTDHLVMNSAISIAANTHGQDAMLYFAVGERGKPQRIRRHGGMQGPHDHIEAPAEPIDLWDSAPDDPFPDPDEDLKGFVEYCGHSLQEISLGVYLVTREMVESGKELKPIAVELPFVFRGEVNMPGSNISSVLKRQADQQLLRPPSPFGEAPEDEMSSLDSFKAGSDFDPQKDGPFPPNFDPQKDGPLPPNFDPQKDGHLPPNFNPQNGGSSPPNFNPKDNGPFNSDEDESKDYYNTNEGGMFQPDESTFDPNNKKKSRCAHIVVPTNNAATPTIGDINGDGKLELTYSVGWEVIPGSEQYIGMTPLKLAIRTFTIEEQFSKIYNEGELDFSRFLPPDKQPWSKYMGQGGDNVYHPEHNLRDH